MSVLYADKTQQDQWSFFYEESGFFLRLGVDSVFPHRGQSHGQFNVVWADDCNSTLEEWASLFHSKATLRSTDAKPGVFHPRIWRGLAPNLTGPILAQDASVYAQTVLATKLISERLFELFAYVEPNPTNLESYGHRSRELLLLACMEVESNWAGVLRANDPKKFKDKRLTTNDYVKLAEPLRLRDFKVDLPMYPDLPTIAPFDGWLLDHPTKSLSWYNDYNSTKHDREQNFECASVGAAVKAVCALATMMCAQFGPDAVPAGFSVEARPVPPQLLYISKHLPTREAKTDGSTRSITYGRQSEVWEAVPFVL